MPARRFLSVDAAEAAFYAALEARDLAALAEIWSRGDDIVCIHPGSARLEGRRQVLDSFRAVIVHGPRLGFSVVDALTTGSESLVVRLVREEIELDGEMVSVMVATNVYRREGGSWRLLVHHASHEPAIDQDEGFGADDLHAEFGSRRITIPFDERDGDDDDSSDDEPSGPSPVLH